MTIFICTDVVIIFPKHTYALPISDFEDATQVAATMAAGVDAIMMRNADDFRASLLLVPSPTELLARLNNSTA